jgi:hypothetical protein
MPGGDGTGPIGRGPMTGRAVGFCSGYSDPGYAKLGFVQGLGRGRSCGFGRGYLGRRRGFWWRNYYQEPYNPPAQYTYQSSKEEEKTYLEKMLKGLEAEIKDIKNRIQELSKEKKESS